MESNETPTCTCWDENEYCRAGIPCPFTDTNNTTDADTDSDNDTDTDIVRLEACFEKLLFDDGVFLVSFIENLINSGGWAPPEIRRYISRKGSQIMQEEEEFRCVFCGYTHDDHDPDGSCR